jgi:anthranilate phosphoribosyltransferase
LRGQDSPAHRDALIIGAGLALEVAGMEPDFARALGRARAAIDTGSAAALLDRIAAFSIAEQAR